jgi:outer membrane receptor protein involved in Fe transport
VNKLETDRIAITMIISNIYTLACNLADPQAGPLNNSNIGVSNSELRANLGLNWQHEEYSANLFARYVDSYSDDQNCADGNAISAACAVGFKDVDSHLTWDAQVNIDLGGLFETDGAYILTVGGINLTDEEPPQLFTNAGFDSKVHDPRGRQIYARVAIEF